MSKSVMLDTSFLICLIDKERANHDNAKSYLEYFLKKEYILYVSTIAISEFTIVDSITTIPLTLFRILPFNFNHSINIETLFYQYLKGTEGVTRGCVKDDLKIITQAEKESIGYYITDDKPIFNKVEQMRNNKLIALRPILLSDKCENFFNLQSDFYNIF